MKPTRGSIIGFSNRIKGSRRIRKQMDKTANKITTF